MTQNSPVAFSRPWIDDGDIERVVQVLRSGWWTTGSVVQELETAFARYVGTAHAVAVSSCTAALHLSLIALGVGPGDLVVTTTFTFAATAEVIAYMGAVPVLLDVDSRTMNLDAVQFRVLCDSLASSEPRRAVQSQIRDGHLPRGVLKGIPVDSDIGRLKAVIPVHYAGQACDMDSILETANRYSVSVVEDAAHAAETTVGGVHAGSLGAVGAFSFYATKNLSTGEGGMVTTNDVALAERIRSLSLHGISKDAWGRYKGSGSWKYDIQEPGFKYNMTDILAALGVGQLARIDQLHTRRLSIVAQYEDSLNGLDGILLPQNFSDGIHAWHLYALRVQRGEGSSCRDGLVEHLRSRGIGTSVHFIPLHMHSYYRRRFGYVQGDFPCAERAFDEVVSLPLYPSLKIDEIECVIREVRAGVNARGIHG